jgi:predicted RNA methylase
MSEEHRQDPEPSCCFDDWVPAWEHKSKRRATIAGVTAPLLDALVEAGIEGRTVLDVGCGIGDLSMAALGRGAERATGIELSP